MLLAKGELSEQLIGSKAMLVHFMGFATRLEVVTLLTEYTPDLMLRENSYLDIKVRGTLEYPTSSMIISISHPIIFTEAKSL